MMCWRPRTPSRAEKEPKVTVKIQGTATALAHPLSVKVEMVSYTHRGLETLAALFYDRKWCWSYTVTQRGTIAKVIPQVVVAQQASQGPHRKKSGRRKSRQRYSQVSPNVRSTVGPSNP